MRQGETWKAVLLGAGIVAGGILAGWAWHKWKKSRNRPYDPLLIKEKLSRLAFSAHLEVTAILSEHGTGGAGEGAAGHRNGGLPSLRQRRRRPIQAGQGEGGRTDSGWSAPAV